MICQNCGVENAANTSFCSNCGSPMPQVQQVPNAMPQVQNVVPPVQQVQNAIPPVNVNVQTQVIPPEYKPLGMWAYFGFELLFAIPVVGIILLIVFACGGTSNINLKNFARSYFCGLLISLAVLLVVVIILAATGGLAVAMSNLNF